MSKIIEALKVRSSPRQDPKAPFASSREINIEKSAHEMTQEQLADIYFSVTGKPKTTEAPVIIRIVERPRSATWIPWMIASIAFFITSISLFSNKRLFVEIKVVDDKSAFVRSLDAQKAEEARGIDAEEERLEDAPDIAVRKIPAKDFLFEGAAYLNSSKDKNDNLVLINSSVAPFARATLHLDPPLDLSGAKVIFYAKGGRGGENVAFAIKDKQNTQGFYKGKIYPFPDRLTTAWQKAEIQIDPDTAKDFDAKNVTSLRFEFGSKDTGNKPNDTVHIKDLQWVKTSA